jgi:hypothetical protein
MTVLPSNDERPVLPVGASGRFNPRIRDTLAMARFFQTGKYVADTRTQAELFGPVPLIEDAVRQRLTDLGFLLQTTGA